MVPASGDMNLLHFLDERLNFALYLYDSTAPRFLEIARKIEAGEEPFVDRRHPDDPDPEPAYLEEWERADLAVEVVGMSCLGLVQSALHAYLKKFVGKDLLGPIKQMKQGSWVENFKAAFGTDPDFDWAGSGVDLSLIEEIVLTRNSFQHGDDLLTVYTFQDDKHAAKYPTSHFGHATWRKGYFRNARLTVTREKLVASVEAVRTLCRFLDDARYKARRSRR